MEHKSTGDLTKAMLGKSSLDSYLRENEPFFSDYSVAELLTGLYEKKSISKAALARAAGMSEVYLHQVFSGRRNPSRDRLICLCIGLEASLEEIQELLKHAALAPLYPRLKRDSIICHGILHHASLAEINDRLFAENEKTLF